MKRATAEEPLYRVKFFEATPTTLWFDTFYCAKAS